MSSASSRYRSRHLLRGRIKLWVLSSLAGMTIFAIILLTSDIRNKVGLSVFDQQLSPDIPGDSLNGESILMDDKRLVEKLASGFLMPPPPPLAGPGPRGGYRLSDPRLKDPSMGQSREIRALLNNKRDGFFVECGALDGETRSNTLYLERFLNWTGLLIEADPLNFAQMTRKRRRAWLSPTCLSKTPHPQIVSFMQHFNIGRISADGAAGDRKAGHTDVQCFPIYTYLLALNVTRVDYFSLDVEGDELDVLKTLPFDKVDIQTLSVEFAHVADGKEALRELMASRGYSVAAEVTHPDWLANDFIFTKNTR